jgi:hypothetical protein
MRRPGTDPMDVRMEDVLCDFCHQPWSDERPMVEGHQGACICGKCLTIAYREVALDNAGSAPADFKCIMCLEGPEDRRALERPVESGWQSPMYLEASICRRCIKQSAGVLHKDPDIEWRKPE